VCNPRRIKPGEREYEFCFVEVGEPSRGRNRDSRSGTRSHVMKDFYGKQRNTVKSCAASRGVATCQTQRFRVGPQGLQELKRRRKRETRGVDKSPPVPSHWTIISNTPCLSLSPTTNPVESTPPTRQSTFAECGQWSYGSRKISESDNLPSIDPIIGYPGLLDPFNTLPVPNNPRTKILLYHGKSSFNCLFLKGVLYADLAGKLPPS